jgi:hypothetical protein
VQELDDRRMQPQEAQDLCDARTCDAVEPGEVGAINLASRDSLLKLIRKRQRLRISPNLITQSAST